MNRSIVCLFDGTGNDKDAPGAAPTNVAKFNGAINLRSIDINYVNGPATNAGAFISGGIGLADTIEEHILEGYEWIASRMHDEETPQSLYLFGFSRGAYIARVVSWILFYCGVPSDTNECSARLRLFKEKNFGELAEIKNGDSVILPENFVKFLGVWDTVKTSNWPDVNDAKLSPIVQKACHAMALDEHRRLFDVLKFDADERAEQEWFAGVHSDVGGGYAECGLSDIACMWMIEKAHECGLKFKKSKVEEIAPNAATGAAHDEFENWRALGEKCRMYEEGEQIHPSVFERIGLVAEYSPRAQNFPPKSLV